MISQEYYQIFVDGQVYDISPVYLKLVVDKLAEKHVSMTDFLHLEDIYGATCWLKVGNITSIQQRTPEIEEKFLELNPEQKPW